MDDEDDGQDSRAPTIEDLARVCDSLDRSEAQYVLIGGFAVMRAAATPGVCGSPEYMNFWRIWTRFGRSAVQVLVDSSVWIDYFTGAATPEADRLDSLLGHSPLVVADVVMMEVLHGMPDELHRKLAREAMGKFWQVELAGFDLAEKSAVHFHTLRARGIPVRTAECRIATFCLDQGFALLHSAAGYEPFEKHLGLQVAR